MLNPALPEVLALLALLGAAPATRRPVPEYDGRPPVGPGAADVLLFAPRALLYPVHLLVEYGVRRPLVGGIALGEKHHVVPRLAGIFTFRDGRAGIFPTFSLRSDMKPQVGASFFMDQAGHEDHDVRARAAGWDSQAFTAAAEDRWRVLEDRSATFTAYASYLRSDDHAFYGLGPSTVEDARLYYLANQIDAGARLDLRLGELSGARLALDYRHGNFGGSDFGDDDDEDGMRNIREVAMPPYAPRFDDGYHVGRVGLGLGLDSRRAFRPDHPGSGVRLDASGALAAGSATFVNYGAALTGILDLTGYEHLLALQVAAFFVERLGDAEVPFTELATLGGPQYMRGFRIGRFRDDSAITASLHYRYPIWVFADAELFSSVGNVFPGHLSDFGVKRLFWSNGLSIKSNFARETAVGFTAAIGSTRFDADDFGLADSVRLFFGVGQGF